MSQLRIPPVGTAQHDPDPKNHYGLDVEYVGKDYHYAWSKKGKLSLHPGFSMKCRRAHFDARGNKVLKPKASK